MQGITIKNILKKKGKKPITCLTAYSKPMAEIIDKYCDIILVGDSVGMVLYGMKTTREVKIDTMILHGKAVKSSTKRSLVVFMPYNTMPTESPTKIISQYLSSILVIVLLYDVKQVIGDFPFFFKISLIVTLGIIGI